MKKLLLLPLMLLAFVACENESMKKPEAKMTEEKGANGANPASDTNTMKDEAAQQSDDKLQQSAKAAQDALNSAQKAAQSARDAAKSAQEALKSN